MYIYILYKNIENKENLQFCNFSNLIDEKCECVGLQDYRVMLLTR